MCCKDLKWDTWKPILKWMSVVASLTMAVLNAIFMWAMIAYSFLNFIYGAYSVIFGLWIAGIELRLPFMANKFRFIEGPRLFGRSAFYVFVSTLQFGMGSTG